MPRAGEFHGRRRRPGRRWRGVFGTAGRRATACSGRRQGVIDGSARRCGWIGYGRIVCKIKLACLQHARASRLKRARLSGWNAASAASTTTSARICLRGRIKKSMAFEPASEASDEQVGQDAFTFPNLRNPLSIAPSLSSFFSLIKLNLPYLFYLWTVVLSKICARARRR